MLSKAGFSLWSRVLGAAFGMFRATDGESESTSQWEYGVGRLDRAVRFARELAEAETAPGTCDHRLYRMYYAGDTCASLVLAKGIYKDTGEATTYKSGGTTCVRDEISAGPMG